MMSPFQRAWPLQLALQCAVIPATFSAFFRVRQSYVAQPSSLSARALWAIAQACICYTVILRSQIKTQFYVLQARNAV
jgi:hypothetical protein